MLVFHPTLPPPPPVPLAHALTVLSKQPSSLEGFPRGVSVENMSEKEKKEPLCKNNSNNHATNQQRTTKEKTSPFCWSDAQPFLCFYPLFPHTTTTPPHPPPSHHPRFLPRFFFPFHYSLTFCSSICQMSCTKTRSRLLLDALPSIFLSSLFLSHSLPTPHIPPPPPQKKTRHAKFILYPPHAIYSCHSFAFPPFPSCSSLPCSVSLVEGNVGWERGGMRGGEEEKDVAVCGTPNTANIKPSPRNAYTTICLFLPTLFITPKVLSPPPPSPLQTPFHHPPFMYGLALCRMCFPRSISFFPFHPHPPPPLSLPIPHHHPPPFAPKKIIVLWCHYPPITPSDSPPCHHPFPHSAFPTSISPPPPHPPAAFTQRVMWFAFRRNEQRTHTPLRYTPTPPINQPTPHKLH